MKRLTWQIRKKNQEGKQKYIKNSIMQNINISKVAVIHFTKFYKNPNSQKLIDETSVNLAKQKLTSILDEVLLSKNKECDISKRTHNSHLIFEQRKKQLKEYDDILVDIAECITNYTEKIFSENKEYRS